MMYDKCIGDWTRPGRPAHICNGCHKNIQAARDDMFSSFIAVDGLQSSDVDKPSLDDWGTCGECCGKTSFGIMLHNILEDIVNAALPTWGAMRPPNDRRHASANGSEIHRMRIQKKGWRTKCFLSDAKLKRKCLYMCWIAAILECLLSTFQFMDEHSHTGLFDIQRNDRRNPIWKARAKIVSLLKRGIDGPLGLIFVYFKTEQHPLMHEEVRTMAMDFNAQLKFRFLDLEGFPLRLTTLADRAASSQEKSNTVRDFYSLCRCCRNAEFSHPVYINFWAPSFEEFEKKIMSDLDFISMLRTIVFCWRFCNMWCERLIALFRNYTSHEAADIERVSACGLLGQVLSEHLKSGGEDPRSTSRKQLLEDGVPLACAKKSDEPKLGGGFPHWMKQQEQERKRQGLKLDRQAYLEWQAEKAREFKALEQAEKDDEFQKARTLLSEIKNRYMI